MNNVSMLGLRTREHSDVLYHNCHAGDGRGELPSCYQLSNLDRRPRSSILAPSHAPLAGLLEMYKKPESPRNKRKWSPASRGYLPLPQSMMDYNPGFDVTARGNNGFDERHLKLAHLTQVIR